MDVQVVLTFKTMDPLSQECGLDLWSIAKHFRSTKARTYKITCALHMDGPAILEEAIAKTKNGVLEILDDHHVDVSHVVFTAETCKIR